MATKVQSIRPQLKARKSNKLVTSPHYAIILKEYNEIYKERGKVNDIKFWRENIHPRIPEYKLMSWYQFLARFKTATSLVAAIVKDHNAPPEVKPSVDIEEAKLEDSLMAGELATNLGIQKALNIGAEAFDMLINHPEMLTPEKRAEYLFKAMKAQDSRITAIRNVRQDTREEAKFQRAFNNAAYSQDNNG
jgi:hypothetical protein